MKKIGWLPIVLLGVSTLALLVLFVLKVIDNNKQMAIIGQTPFPSTPAGVRFLYRM